MRLIYPKEGPWQISPHTVSNNGRMLSIKGPHCTNYLLRLLAFIRLNRIQSYLIEFTCNETRFEQEETSGWKLKRFGLWLRLNLNKSAFYNLDQILHIQPCDTEQGLNLIIRECILPCRSISLYCLVTSQPSWCEYMLQSHITMQLPDISLAVSCHWVPHNFQLPNSDQLWLWKRNDYNTVILESIKENTALSPYQGKFLGGRYCKSIYPREHPSYQMPQEAGYVGRQKMDV